MVGIGIDFGTSNSSLATFDGRALRYLALEPHPPREVMPTALYLNRRRQGEVGRAAIAAYIRDNAGRTVRLRPEHIGQIEITVAGTDSTKGPEETGGGLSEWGQVHAFADRELPGRLFRSIKRWLGGAGVDRLRVFDTHYRIVALVTPILVRVRSALEAAGLADSGSVHIGHPIQFPGRGPDANQQAIARLSEACRHAGFKDFCFYPEPVAAALSFLHPRRRRGVENVLSFDFGGGTLDLAVLRQQGADFKVLAVGGLAVGGDTIDALIYRKVVFPELGEGALVESALYSGPRKIPFWFERYEERLLNWPLAYELARPELLEPIAQGAREGGEVEKRLGRLHKLITENLSYRVFLAVEQAKITLSERGAARIEVPELDLSVAVERSTLEALLRDMLARIDAEITLVLERAGVEGRELSTVVRTGGSSRIPAVRALLENRFPGRVEEHDPFTSIAGGLAIASYHGHGL